MKRPANVLKVNTEIRNVASRVATAMASEKKPPQTIRVELRKYSNDDTLTCRWDADVATGELRTECVNRLLDETTYELSAETKVCTDVPERASTRVNLIDIATTPMKKQYKWLRSIGLLVSCAWQVWDADDSEVVVSFIRDNKVFLAATFDGQEVIAE